MGIDAFALIIAIIALLVVLAVHIKEDRKTRESENDYVDLRERLDQYHATKR